MTRHTVTPQSLRAPGGRATTLTQGGRTTTHEEGSAGAFNNASDLSVKAVTAARPAASYRPRRPTPRPPQLSGEPMDEPARASVAFDDDRIRVTNWTFPTLGSGTGQHRHEFDYVVVPITGGSFTVTSPDGSARTMTQVAGTPYLGSAGTAHEVANATDRPATFVEVEMKR
jgi:hypothetical protein